MHFVVQHYPQLDIACIGCPQKVTLKEISRGGQSRLNEFASFSFQLYFFHESLNVGNWDDSISYVSFSIVVCIIA